MFHGGSGHIAKRKGNFYSDVSTVESWVFGRLVNKHDEVMNGRNIVFDGCSMLLPKRIVFRTLHAGAPAMPSILSRTEEYSLIFQSSGSEDWE